MATDITIFYNLIIHYYDIMMDYIRGPLSRLWNVFGSNGSPVWKSIQVKNRPN